MRKVSQLFILVAIFVALATGSVWAATIINVPGDQPTIQAAVDAASSGDTIIVSPGTYYENVVVNTPNLTIKGAGDKKNRPYVDGGNISCAFYINATGVTVEGFEAYAYGQDVIAVKADYVTILDNKVRGPGPFISWLNPSPSPGISVIECSHVNILKNDIRDTTGAGIWVGAATHISILNNKTENTQYEGILIVWWDSWANASSNCRIVGNKVKKTGDLTWVHPLGGIRVGRNCHDNYVGRNDVSNCLVHATKGGGIHAHKFSYDNVFHDNKMHKITGFVDAMDMTSAPGANFWWENKFKTSSGSNIQ